MPLAASGELLAVQPVEYLRKNRSAVVHPAKLAATAAPETQIDDMGFASEYAAHQTLP
jgi:hypothetical protein